MTRLDPVDPFHDEHALRREVPVHPRDRNVHLPRRVWEAELEGGETPSPASLHFALRATVSAPAPKKAGAGAARAFGWCPECRVRASSAACSRSELAPSCRKSSSMFCGRRGGGLS